MSEVLSGRQRVAEFFGLFVVIIALFFLGSRIWEHRSFFSEQPLHESLLLISLGSVFYGLNCFLLVVAWKKLLGWSGQEGMVFSLCYVIYARTQLAKYIPGNVFQFASRHLAGRQAGFRDKPMVTAAVYEIVSLLLASSAIALFGIVFLGFESGNIPIAGVFAVFLCMLLFPFLVFKSPLGAKLHVAEKNMRDIFSGLVPVCLLHLLFCLVAGGILLGIVTFVYQFKGMDIHRVGIVISVFAISWIAGFLTPGAPAGLGVREAIMVVSLAGLIGESKSLYVALAFRIITSMGDFLFFLSSLAVDAKMRPLSSRVS